MIHINPITLIIAYFCIINLTGFVLMGIDKRKAIRHAYRISEAALFITALMGGSIGSILGMYAFRHKTKHWTFVVGMPAIMTAQILLALCILLL